MQDNIFDIFEQDKIEQELFEEQSRANYYKRIPKSEALADRTYLEVHLRASGFRRRYIRENYDILSYLGDLGGLFEIAFSSGKLLTALFVTKMFQAALIRSVYKI